MRTLPQPGGIIGVYSLSSPMAPDRLAQASDFCRARGVRVRLPLDPSARYNAAGEPLFVSGTTVERVDSFLALLRDPTVDVLMAARGGYGASLALPSLATQLVNLPKDNRIICGFSDATALLMLLYKVGFGVPVHGVTFDGTFSHAGSEGDALARAEGALQFFGTGRSALHGMEVQHLSGGDSVAGPVIAGNLSVIAGLIGTDFLPSFRDHVVFLEDTGEAPHRLHRALTQLRLAGLLDGIRGVVFGELQRCDYPNGRTPTAQQAVVDALRSLSLPLFSLPAVGHGKVNHPLPLGAAVVVREGRVFFDSPGT